MHARFTTLIVAGGLACAVTGVQAVTASAAADNVMIRGAEFNLRTDQLIVVAADTDVTAVLTVSVTSTGQKIGTLTNYYSAADPTDVQSGMFTVTVNGVITHPAEITRPGFRSCPSSN
jgi:hypothetical protein